MKGRDVQIVLVAGVASLASARGASAQSLEPDNGPIVIGERKQLWNWFEVANYGAAFEFLGSYRRDRQTQTGQPTLVDRETIARESLELFGEAYIGHKNLIDLNAKVRLQLENHWLTSGTLNSDDRTRELDVLYDINAHCLGATQFPFDVYARRDQQNLNRDFGTALRQNTSEYGVLATFQSATFPTSLQLSHSESDQRDPLGGFGYSFKKDSLSLQSAIIASDSHRIETRYILDSVSENQRGVYSTSYIRHDLSIDDSLYFGEKKWGELRSYFKFYDQGGLFDQRTIRLDEQLRLTHSEDLESRYNASIEQRSRGASDQNTARILASIRHKLFQSLVTNANVGFQRFDANGFVSNELFFGASAEYTKRIPYGRLDLNLGFNYNDQQNSARGTPLAVFSESYTYSGGISIIVPRRNVINGSLRVTGPGGAPTYVEGVDYTVNYFPDRVEIVPIPGQGIATGSNVLLDYNIGPEPSSTIDTLTTSAAVRYTITESWLEGLSGYASYRATDHSLRAADPSIFSLDDVTETQFGLEYRRFGLTVRAEQEFRASTLNPYDTTRFQALYDHRLGLNSVISFDATTEFIKYRKPVNEIDFTRAGVRWLQQLGPTLELDSRLIYRNERNNLSGNSQGIDARLGLRWHLRQTSAYINGGQTIFGTSSSRTTSTLLEFGFRREF